MQLFDIGSSTDPNARNEIRAFPESIGLAQLAPGRFSFLLVLQLFGGYKSGTTHPARIMDEIRALESGDQRSKLKPPIQNRHPPLKGLWHKHYLQDEIPSMAMNVKKGLDRHGMPFFDQIAKEAADAGETRYLSPDDIPRLVDDMVSGNLRRLADQEALTGEWLMFAKHEGQNYYLCLATHDSSTHMKVRAEIEVICCVEFPFLKSILSH